MGNALRLDWLEVCPPTREGNNAEHDLGGPTGRLALEGYGLEGTKFETYICGNPPYIGDKRQNSEQKNDMKFALSSVTDKWRSLDYIAGFFFKAAQYNTQADGCSAFVSTNSICQGQQVPYLWSLLLEKITIVFAHTSFKWSNLAARNAGVTCVVIGIGRRDQVHERTIFHDDLRRIVANISPYIIPGSDLIIEGRTASISGLPKMTLGNMPKDDGGLLLSMEESSQLGLSERARARLLRRIFGSAELINGLARYALWIEDADLEIAKQNPSVAARIEHVQKFRAASTDAGVRKMAERPHQFREMNVSVHHSIATPRVSSENREYLPVDLLPASDVVTDRNYALYDAPLWTLSLIASRLHWVWIGIVCVRMRTDFSYSSTLGWNTFPVPNLTEQDKTDRWLSIEPDRGHPDHRPCHT